MSDQTDAMWNALFAASLRGNIEAAELIIETAINTERFQKVWGDRRINESLKTALHYLRLAKYDALDIATETASNVMHPVEQDDTDSAR